MDQLPPYYFEHLKQGLWHCTSLEKLKEIHRAGEIRGSGAELTTQYQNSYAYDRRAVSLFCFERATEEQALDFAFQGNDSLYRCRPTPVFIEVDRGTLGNGLVENHCFHPEYNKRGKYRSEVLEFLWLPYCEVWCLKPIPLNAVTGYVVTSSADQRMFRFVVPAGPDVLKEIVRVAAELS